VNIQQELAAAQDKTANAVIIHPPLSLRHRLAEFAVVNGLPNEAAALAIVAARYFRMAESTRWAGWFAEESER